MLALFPAQSEEACANVTIISDLIALEGEERFIVQYDEDLLPRGVSAGTYTEATITIQDSDSKLANKHTK